MIALAVGWINLQELTKHMKRRVLNDDEAVSPVIATILMVAITVVLAATLYMMLPKGTDTGTTTAMSGRVDKVSDGWLIQIDGGSVDFDGTDFRLYNTTSGASVSGTASETGDFTVDGTTYGYTFNDNDANDKVNGGDSIKIVDANFDLEDDYEFRIADTNLALTLE